MSYYRLRKRVEDSLVAAVIAAGAAVAVGSDNPSSLPVVRGGMSADDMDAPYVTCACLNAEEAIETVTCWRAHCEIEVVSRADYDDSDGSDDPEEGHSDNCERVFDAFFDTEICTTLTNASFNVMQRGLLNRKFSFTTTNREFHDVLSFDLICNLIS